MLKLHYTYWVHYCLNLQKAYTKWTIVEMSLGNLKYFQYSNKRDNTTITPNCPKSSQPCKLQATVQEY